MISIEPTASDLLADKADLLVIGVTPAELLKSGPSAELDRRLGGALKSLCRDRHFSGKAKQQLLLPSLGQLPQRHLALVGLGSEPGPSADAFLRLGGTAVRLGESVAAKSVALLAPAAAAGEAARCGWLARGAWLGHHQFDLYRDLERPLGLKRLRLHSAEVPAAKGACARAQIVAQAAIQVRDWVNISPSELNPATLAAAAVAAAKSAKLSSKVLLPADLKRLGMNLLLAVGSGSAIGPRLVELTYTPKGANRLKGPPVVLIGKGITFDSGGLSLKSADAMVTMKMDMGGAAAVIATLAAAARLKLRVPLIGIVALAENMPSGTACRPGDVVRSAAGKTVEINNTDAEGRLVLADAMHHAARLKPRCIIDLATLTGACMVALGPTTAGIFANDTPLAEALLAAAARVGESMWRLPLLPSLGDQLKSDIADMRNTGDRFGGAITAALFLQRFAGSQPWAHLDIAGPAMSSEEGGHMHKGGTGIGVATLLDYLLEGYGTAA